MGLFNKMPKIVPQIKIPIGCIFDIVTGSPVVGAKGETYCNGGLSNLSMISGRGNSFKSTIGNYMLLTAASRIVESGYTPDGFVYDSELNYDVNRFEELASKVPFLPENILTGEDRMWTITSPGNTLENEDITSDDKKKKKDIYTADVFVDDLQNELNDRAKTKNNMEISCLLNPYNKSETLKIHTPMFGIVDSISELNSENINKILEENLDSSSTNMYAMRQGGFRTKFLITLPPMLSRANGYMVLIAQSGKKVDVDANMYAPKDPGMLKHLKDHQNLKGVGSKSSFLTAVLWTAEKEDLLETRDSSGKKVAQYPLSPDDETSVDLNVVWLKTARSKSGLTGVVVPVVVSQFEGVQPSLTEFHYLMVNGKYGISGNDRDYYLDLYPDVKLNRRIVRKLINEDPKLRRAINITAEMKQIEQFQSAWLLNNGLKCTPKQLYEDIKNLGYDWNELLDTRGYWLPNQYKSGRNFLSTYDLLKMRVGQYTPYFMKEKKK